MKLVFFTQDGEIEELVDIISGVEVILTDALEGLEREIEDERCLFFIDFDFDKKHAEQVNQELFDHGNVRRIIISSGMRLKDLKKHQKGKFAAHGYLIKPLTLEIVNGVLNDYELSDYITDNQLEDEESGIEEAQLTDIGGKKPVIKEFGFNPEVRAEMDKHSATAGDPDFDSTLNISIQAKFDDVFGTTAHNSEYEEEDEDEAFSPDSDDIPDFSNDIDEIPSLEVNFDSDEKTAPDLSAGLSPEDGTGEFEISTEDFAEISSENTEEVAMASNDDLDLDDNELEFDDGNDEVELEEGALEFDGGGGVTPDTEVASASSGDNSDDIEFGNDENIDEDDDEVSISLGADDLDLGDDPELGDEEAELNIAAGNDSSSDGDLEFGDDDLNLDDDLEFGSDDSAQTQEVSEDTSDDLDFDENTNPTMVATSSEIPTSALNLEDDDIAEFSAQSEQPEASESTTTSTASEVELDEDDSGFSLDDDLGDELADDDLSFGDDGDDEDELTAATTIAPSSVPKEFSYTGDVDETSNNFKAHSKREEALPHGQVLESLGQPELLRLQATIKQLREERTGLIDQMDDLKGRVRLLEQDKLTLKAEHEEARIEINILKKRHSEENEETKHKNRVLEERKAFFEEKARTLQKEFDRLSQKIRIDFNKVKQREKELESQLELVTMDTQSQVKSRDMKILDLKRKIDSLEFNMENATIREQKSRDDKVRLEERLGKIMKTLRGSIQLLEDDIDLDEETRAQIAKARKL